MNQSFLLQIISRDGILFEGKSVFVELDTKEGRVGIYKGHVPQFYFVTKGTVLFFTENQEKRRIKVEKGFARVQFEQVMILVSEAVFLQN